MRKELIKPSKDSKIRLTSNRVLCIPFFLLLGAYMLFGAAMTPLSPMEESYKVMETIERYIGIAICVYVCIYSLVSITQKDTPVIKKYLCFLLLVTGIIGFFYLRSGFLYFDLVMIISLICATQESKKVNAENESSISRL
jgi:hypothetical protein